MSWIVETFFLWKFHFTLFVSLVRKCLNEIFFRIYVILFYITINCRCNELLSGVVTKKKTPFVYVVSLLKCCWCIILLSITFVFYILTFMWKFDYEYERVSYKFSTSEAINWNSLWQQIKWITVRVFVCLSVFFLKQICSETIFWS